VAPETWLRGKERSAPATRRRAETLALQFAVVGAERVASTRRAAPIFSPPGRGWAMHRLLPPFRPLSIRRGPLLVEQPFRTVIGAFSSADSDSAEALAGPARSEPALMPRGVRGLNLSALPPSRRDRSLPQHQPGQHRGGCWLRLLAGGRTWSYGLERTGGLGRLRGPKRQLLVVGRPPPKRKCPGQPRDGGAGLQASPSATACGRVAADKICARCDRAFAWRLLRHGRPALPQASGRFGAGCCPPGLTAVHLDRRARIVRSARRPAWPMTRARRTAGPRVGLVLLTGPCGRPATRALRFGSHSAGLGGAQGLCAPGPFG